MSWSRALRSIAGVGILLLAVVGQAAPAAAYAAGQPIAAEVTTMSSGRLGASVGGMLGLLGVVFGWLALARPARRLGTGSGPLGAGIALTAGLVGVALGGLVIATSDGGVGTGNGLAGAFVAVVVGLIAVGLGGLALVRSRRTGRSVPGPQRSR
ncbi:DUF6223 family protein [Actinoplanes auranticolor]|uniref:Uncharacterized protein n=1 Tax=Actinoplanes auranticolor TaxID=47988 RepID=A0A919VLC9_9ACTN|nr:DUF6223 family protein [Actinoplanes auranticolor]GIM67558.1 hypothetical protein Aau02nite_27810 [Actinoplanes auranticolor]